MSFLTYIFGKGYTGGPDFSQLESFSFDLEGIELRVTVPKRRIALARKDWSDSLPFRSPGWFDHHCEQQNNHFYSTVFVDLWPYVGPIWRTGMDRTFGILGMQVWIKRVRPEKVLDMNNLDTLAEAIRWEYEWFFEVEEPGEFGRGWNRRARQEAEDEYNSRNPIIPEEMKLRDKEDSLNYSLQELPTHFESRRYGDQEWLYYALRKEANTTAHYYCIPLDDQFFLSVRFGYRIDLSNYLHLWQANAKAAEQRIMETLILTFPNRLQAPGGSIVQTVSGR